MLIGGESPQGLVLDRLQRLLFRAMRVFSFALLGLLACSCGDDASDVSDAGGTDHAGAAGHSTGGSAAGGGSGGFGGQGGAKHADSGAGGHSGQSGAAAHSSDAGAIAEDDAGVQDQAGRGSNGLIVRQLAAGERFTCALTVQGGVKCWGENNYGVIGNGTTGGSFPTATDVMGLNTGVRSIAAGANHVCAVKQDDSLLCWGANEYHQLAIDPNLRMSGTPVALAGFSGRVKYISLSPGMNTSGHGCLIDDQDRVQCWGMNAWNELGAATPSTTANPIHVSDLDGRYTALAAGSTHTCGVMSDGHVQCWGERNFGALGDGAMDVGNSTPPSPIPLEVSALTDVKTLMAGIRVTCALLVSGAVKCWGSPELGALGSGIPAMGAGSVGSMNFPMDVVGLSAGVSQIATGSHHSCAVVANGEIVCWGSNQNGELGNQNRDTVNMSVPSNITPVAVIDVKAAVAIAAGDSHSCAALDAGGVKCWGFGGATTGTTHNGPQLTPVAIEGF